MCKAHVLVFDVDVVLMRDEKGMAKWEPFLLQ